MISRIGLLILLLVVMLNFWLELHNEDGASILEANSVDHLAYLDRIASRLSVGIILKKNMYGIAR